MSWRRVGATLLLACAALLLTAGPATAHTELVRSDPADGGTVGVGRTQLTLWFGEPVDPGQSTYALHGPDGAPVDVTVRPPGADGGQVVELSTPPLTQGTFVLDWRAVDLEDGHTTSGSVVFGVGVRPTGAVSSTSTVPEGPDLLLRWLDLSSIMLAVGATAVSGRVLASMGDADRRPLRRARRIGAAAATAAGVTGALTPLVRIQRGESPVGTWLSETWATLVGTSWGTLWLAREVALLCAVGLLWSWALRARSGRVPARAAMAALVAAAALEAWAGHAAELPRRAFAAAVAGAGHLVAAGVWVGGLVVLAVCVLPGNGHRSGGRRRVVATVWRAFSPRAAGAALVVVATGLYAAGRHVPTLRSLTSTVYGGAVAAKLLLVGVALVLAGGNTLVVNPGLRDRVGRALGRPAGWDPVPLPRFPVVVAAEVAMLLLATGLAAVLVSVPTARAVEAATTPAAAPVVATADGLFLTVEDVAAGPERSRLIVRVRSTVLPDPAPVRGVDAVLTDSAGTDRTVALSPIEEGRYEADTTGSAPGAWQAEIRFHRAGRADSVARVGWTVPRPDTGAVRPLEVVGTATVVVLLVLLVLLPVGIALQRRRRTVAAVPAPADAALSDRPTTTDA